MKDKLPNPVLELLRDVEKYVRWDSQTPKAMELFGRLAKLLRSGEERFAMYSPNEVGGSRNFFPAHELDDSYKHRYHLTYLGPVPAPVKVTDDDVAEAAEMLETAYPRGSFCSDSEAAQLLAKFLATKRTEKADG